MSRSLAAAIRSPASPSRMAGWSSSTTTTGCSPSIAEKLSATVQAGISIARLSEELDRNGLALENLGDINYQSISGAISTATHGTGRAFGGIATQVTGLRLITGDGSIIECSAEKEPEVFSAARVGLGALGIISTVTLRCVKAFNLRVVEMPERVDQVLERLDENIRENDHFEFFWVPNTGWALTKRNQRTNDPLATARPLAGVSGRHSGQQLRFRRTLPRRSPQTLAYPARRAGVTEHRAHRVRRQELPGLLQPTPRSLLRDGVRRAVGGGSRGVQPRAPIPQAERPYPDLPVEVRFTAGDDIPLSTASGRDSCYIAVHVFEGMQYQQYFEAVEDIMNDYGGRPHWGKLHFQTAETLAPRYPQWEAFQAVRARVDPEGRFANPYLDRVLGRVRAAVKA